MNNKIRSLSGIALFCLSHIGNAVYADVDVDYPPSSCEEGKRVAFTYSHYAPWPAGQKSRSSLNFSTQLPPDNEIKLFQWLLPVGITVNLAEDRSGSDQDIFQNVSNETTTPPTQVNKLYVAKPQNATNRFRIDVCGITEVEGQCYSTDWFSEEGSGRADCDPGYAVRGITCEGRYCDNKQLYCCTDNLPTLDPNNRIDSPWFSEEDSDGFVDENRALTGLGCSGRYCDNLQMTMHGFEGGTPPIQSSWWQNGFSEEPPGYDRCRDNGYVAGIKCSGDYCDNLRFFCINYNVN